MSTIDHIIDQLEEWSEYNTKKQDQIIAEKESDIQWLKSENSFLVRQNADLQNKLARQREIIYTKQAEINELIRQIEH